MTHPTQGGLVGLELSPLAGDVLGGLAILWRKRHPTTQQGQEMGSESTIKPSKCIANWGGYIGGILLRLSNPKIECTLGYSIASFREPLPLPSCRPKPIPRPKPSSMLESSAICALRPYAPTHPQNGSRPYTLTLLDALSALTLHLVPIQPTSRAHPTPSPYPISS